jgi:Tol biopolymer transport system component
VVGLRQGAGVAISPDGRTLAFTARDQARQTRLWVRSLDAVDARIIAGTDDAQFPFWSPDGRFIAFFNGTRLLRVALRGGPPQIICDWGGIRGGAWLSANTIVLAAIDGLYQVSAAGGTPSHITSGVFRSPSRLPDEQHVLVNMLDPAGNSEVVVASLDGAAPKRLLGNLTTAAVFAPPDHLLFARDETLFAQAFDSRRFELIGEPDVFPTSMAVSSFSGSPQFSASANGVLAIPVGLSNLEDNQLTWVDRAGRPVGTVGQAGDWLGIDLSPDGKTIVAHKHEGAGGDLWIIDATTSATSRFTFDLASENSYPIWSPDGRMVAFKSVRDGRPALYVKPFVSAGPEEKLIDGAGPELNPRGWSPDQQSFFFDASDPKTSGDVWMLPLAGARQPVPLVRAAPNERFGQVSPDGKWLAYGSYETGSSEIYVRPVTSEAGKKQVSTAGGVYPTWRQDSKELFFSSDPSYGTLMAVDIDSTGPTLKVGVPQRLFDVEFPRRHPGGPPRMYDVTANGQRFLLSRPPLSGNSPPLSLVVVLNWTRALTQ